MSNRYDAIIIGSGVIGASIALGLARRGLRSLNLDANPAAGYGSTSSSCAIIRTHYSTLQGTLLAWESLLYWKHWSDFLDIDATEALADFRNTGVAVLLCGGKSQSLWRAHHATLGIPYEEWDVTTLEEQLPYVGTTSYGPPRRPDDVEFGVPNDRTIEGAFFVPEGGYVSDPQLAARNLQQAAEKLGANFLFGKKVASIGKESGRVDGVTLEDGTRFSSPVVVNAAGPHSFQVNRMAGVTDDMSISTRPMRHEVHYVPGPKGVDLARQGVVLSDDDVGGYCRPESGNALLIGSQDPACDPQEWVDDPDVFDRGVSTDQWHAQVYRMALRIPDLPIPARAAGIADLYDVTEDWIPIYDRSSLDGFYIAAGTSGNQFKNAPVVGQLMSSLIEACESGHNHDEDPLQFHCELTGGELDLSCFSRKRQVNGDSSFSVLG